MHILDVLMEDKAQISSKPKREERRVSDRRDASPAVIMTRAPVRTDQEMDFHGPWDGQVPARK